MAIRANINKLFEASSMSLQPVVVNNVGVDSGTIMIVDPEVLSSIVEIDIEAGRRAGKIIAGRIGSRRVNVRVMAGNDVLEEKQGVVDCKSGKLYVGDPAYIIQDNDRVNKKNDPWKKFLKITKYGDNAPKGSMILNSFGGDGRFTVEITPLTRNPYAEGMNESEPDVAFLDEARDYHDLASYKALISSGLEDITSPVQVKHGTVVFNDKNNPGYMYNYTGKYVRKLRSAGHGVTTMSVWPAAPGQYDKAFKLIASKAAKTGDLELKKKIGAEGVTVFNLTKEQYEEIKRLAFELFLQVTHRKGRKDKEFFESYESALKALGEFYSNGIRPGQDYPFPLVGGGEEFRNGPMMREFGKSHITKLIPGVGKVFAGYMALGNAGIGFIPNPKLATRKLKDEQ